MEKTYRIVICTRDGEDVKTLMSVTQDPDEHQFRLEEVREIFSHSHDVNEYTEEAEEEENDFYELS